MVAADAMSMVPQGLRVFVVPPFGQSLVTIVASCQSSPCQLLTGRLQLPVLGQMSNGWHL